MTDRVARVIGTGVKGRGITRPEVTAVIAANTAQSIKLVVLEYLIGFTS